MTDLIIEYKFTEELENMKLIETAGIWKIALIL